MNNGYNKPIRPELLAENLAAAARMEDVRLSEQLEKEPRLGELLRAIQWFSFQPGGLAKLSNDVVEECPDRILTVAMKKAGPPGRDGQWTLEQALIAWRSEWNGPCHYRSNSQLTEMDRRIRCFDLEISEFCEPEGGKIAPSSDCDFDAWLGFYFDGELTADKVNRGIGCDKTNIFHGLRRFNHGYFKSEAVKTVAGRLASYMYDLCTLPNRSMKIGPTWFTNVIPVLLDFLDRHAARERLTIAETEVSKVIADVLDDTWETNGLGRISGDTGFGKTEKLKAECRAYPGRWRMVEAPLGDSLSDLIRAVGEEALGMAFPLGRLRPEDRQKVEFVLRNMRPGVVIDEAHRLCPQQFNRNSVAERYDWVRWAIVDHKLPCVLSVTFQTDKGETTEQRESRFVKTTGFNMEQFTRRIGREVSLPNVLSRADFMAVGRHHCGNLKKSTFDKLVNTAMASPGGLGVFGRVKLRAARLAERRGSHEVAWQDFNDAIAMEPGIPAKAHSLAVESPGCAIQAKPAEPSRKQRKTPAETVRELFPGRSQTDLSVSRIPSGCSEGLLTAPVLEAV